MAEEKKPAKAGDKGGDKKPEGWNLAWDESIIIVLLLAGVLVGALPLLFGYLRGGEWSFFGIPLGGFIDALRSLSPFFKFLGLAVAGFFAVGTFIFNKKADGIFELMKTKIYPENMVFGIANNAGLKNPTLDKWKQIVEWSESNNEANLRLSIIEADIILDSLLKKLGLPGETMGDKLKAVERSDFNTIDDAWEAHKARNNIAHQGSEFLLNQREARRIISLYERVFREFYLI